jgi:hypothetical protein
MAVGDFPIDENMRGGPTEYPSPPDGHPRRCQAKRSKNSGGGQCRRWALADVPYCRFHGGGFCKPRPDRKWKENPYGRVSVGKLEVLLDMMGEMNVDKTDLAGELDVARALAAEAVERYSNLLDRSDADDKEDRPTDRELMGAARWVQNCTSKVSALAKRYVEIQALNRDTFSKDQVRYVIHTVISILSRHVLPANPEVYEKVCDKIAAIEPPSKDQEVVFSIT